MATARTVSPRATRGSSALCCASVPASMIVSAPSTPDVKNGPGNGPRPSSSYRTAASVSVLSPPPWRSGMSMPSQPSSDAFCQRSGTRLDSARCNATIVWRGASRSTKLRAADRNISCDSVSERSMRSALVLLQALEREAAVAPRRARRHGHGDERGLGDLLVGGPGDGRFLGVGLDAPGALGDLRDAERDQLLVLARDRAVLERLLIELEERAIRLRDQLAHALELLADLDTVKVHDHLPRKTGLRFSRQAWWPSALSSVSSRAAKR